MSRSGFFITIILIALLVPLATLPGEAQGANGANGNGSAGDAQGAGARLSVVATHLPVWCLTARIAGNRADISVLVPPGSDVHAYSMRPGDIRAVAAADLVVASGAGLESPFQRGLALAAKTVDASDGLELITSGVDNINPHIWLNPVMAEAQAAAIRDALMEVDPGGAELYAENARQLIAALRAMDAEAQRRLAPMKGAVLLTYHESFTYFARRYGLRTFSLTGPNDHRPLPGRMRQAYDMIKAGGVPAIFSEETYPDEALIRMREDLGVRLCTLDTITSGPLEADYYIKVMRRNIDVMVDCLGGADE